MYNYNHLYYFYITAQFGSITKASEHLNISQPSLSSQVKILEESFNLNLFMRNGRNIELTNKGKVVYEYCSQMFKDIDGLTKFLSNQIDKNQTTFKIAVSDQVERPFIAEIVGKLIKKYKKDSVPKITMITDFHDRLMDQFKLGNVDLIITHKKTAMTSALVSTVDFPVALIGQPKFLTRDGRNFKNITALLKNYQSGFVMPAEKFKLRSEINIYLAKEKYSSKIFFESDILAANVRALEEGVGIGFLPIAYVKKELKKGVLCSYAPTLGCWSHQLFVITSTDKTKNLIADEFKRLFIQETTLN